MEQFNTHYYVLLLYRYCIAFLAKDVIFSVAMIYLFVLVFCWSFSNIIQNLIWPLLNILWMNRLWWSVIEESREVNIKQVI